MIKGINKYVIEVSETSNRYYDKALLFIKPEYADVQRELLEKEAEKLIRNMDTPSIIKQHKKLMYWGLRIGISVLIGAMSSIIFVNMLPL